MDINYFLKTRILDGGMGQELLARGMKPNGTLWSANALLDENLAYKENDGPYRFKVNREKDYFEYEDLILGNIKIPSENIEDFSIARSDKSPTFILSNLVDDQPWNDRRSTTFS